MSEIEFHLPSPVMIDAAETIDRAKHEIRAMSVPLQVNTRGLSFSDAFTRLASGLKDLSPCA